ncbi:MAG: penicillin acylase family protein, partial [Gemmatimonadetes bacterium]|nr:penicillin acylase family protein [Gemmatimonadota bacterium]
MRTLLFTLVLLGAALADAQDPRKDLARYRRLAAQVTILRDRFGVPHVQGRSDAATMFGMAYARAEDRYQETEPDYIRLMARSAELEGESGVAMDTFLKALEVERLGREEYAAASPALRAIVDAWADGTNYFLQLHPDVQPRLPVHYEGWMMFAMHRSFTAEPTALGVDLKAILDLPATQRHPEEGSNMWAVSAAKSASGHAMLFLNPHTPLLPVYESHWISDEGWNVSGLTAYANTLVPVLGHNEHLGWSLTVNESDLADAWEETFDRADDPLAYRHGTGYRRATEWRDSIRVRATNGSVTWRTLTLRKTHHGPILGRRGNKWIAVNFAGVVHGGIIPQWYAMGKARNLAEFRKALDINGLVSHNVMYADTAGHIYYVHASPVPRRDTTLDWRGILDGSDPRSDWQGFHTPAEMPQVLDPPSGWMQNTNSTPFLTTTADANPRRADFPKYIGLHPDNWRARASRALLSRPGKFTLDEWSAMAFDRYFYAADRDLPLLFVDHQLLAAVDPGRAQRLTAMIDTLRTWDRRG